MNVEMKRPGEGQVPSRVPERDDALPSLPNVLEIDALEENLPEVQAFVEERLEAAGCPMKTEMQVQIAVEEIFINIASYAYSPGRGKAFVDVSLSEEPKAVTITFRDCGVPFNPITGCKPELSGSAEERRIGGLGIFMAIKLMDEVSYNHREGWNILTLKKSL